jgi:acyl-CoA synthetase (AMP-forming)/AMP-acid ligase II
MNSPSLYHQFQRSARAHADRLAIRSDTQDLSYSALETESRRVAMALMASGAQRGDRIAIWGVNSADWVVSALAIQAVGGVLVPVGTRLRGREVKGILDDSSAKFIFCDRAFGDYDYVEAIESVEAASVERIIVFDDESVRNGRVSGLKAFAQETGSITESDLDTRIARGSGSDLADIIFTSGTTGRPKGVPMTNAQSLIACQVQQDEIARFTPEDVFAVTFPFAHNAGYRAGWQVAVLNGVCIIPVRVFEPSAMLKMIEQERITFLPTVVAVAQSLMDHPDRATTDLSSLRIISTGGTTIPVKLIEDMRRYTGTGTEVQTGYGLTETAGSVTATGADDSASIISTTVGHALSCFDVKIVDPSHKELPRGEVGEIAVRGPQVLHGYYNNPAATAEAFTSDGFFLTGDAGSMDDAGNIRITDRIKDMYLAGGFNCYPAEIEQTLCTMPGVAQAAVIGVDDVRLGQVGKAFIVRSAGSDIDEAAVIAWCRNEMANYKVPRSVVFLDALPLNATGKVSKVDLRAR